MDRAKYCLKVISILLTVLILGQDIGLCFDGTAAAPTPSPAAAVMPDIWIVEDAHSSLRGQLQTAKILRVLSALEKATFIGVEGQSGEVRTEFLSAFPDRQIREMAAYELLREARISSAEYAAIASTAALRIEGVEDPEDYLKNWRNYRRLRSGSAGWSTALSKLESMFIAAEVKLVRPELRRILDELDASSAAASHDRDWTDRLKKDLELLSDAGVVSRLWEDLLQQPDPEGASANPIRPENEWLSELQRLYGHLALLQASGPDELKAFHEAWTLRRLRRVLLVEASREDHLAAEQWEKFNAGQLIWRLYRILGSEWRSGRRPFTRSERAALDRRIRKSMDFYHDAVVREHSMADQMLVRMKAVRAKKGALIVGGFHTEGLVREFRGRGMRVTVLRPRLAQVDEDRGYAERALGPEDRDGGRGRMSELLYAMFGAGVLEGRGLGNLKKAYLSGAKLRGYEPRDSAMYRPASAERVQAHRMRGAFSSGMDHDADATVSPPTVLLGPGLPGAEVIGSIQIAAQLADNVIMLDTVDGLRQVAKDPRSGVITSSVVAGARMASNDRPHGSGWLGWMRHLRLVLIGGLALAALSACTSTGGRKNEPVRDRLARMEQSVGRPKSNFALPKLIKLTPKSARAENASPASTSKKDKPASRSTRPVSSFTEPTLPVSVDFPPQDGALARDAATLAEDTPSLLPPLETGSVLDEGNNVAPVITDTTVDPLAGDGVGQDLITAAQQLLDQTGPPPASEGPAAKSRGVETIRVEPTPAFRADERRIKVFGPEMDAGICPFCNQQTGAAADQQESLGVPVVRDAHDYEYDSPADALKSLQDPNKPWDKRYGAAMHLMLHGHREGIETAYRVLNGAAADPNGYWNTESARIVRVVLAQLFGKIGPNRADLELLIRGTSDPNYMVRLICMVELQNAASAERKSRYDYGVDEFAGALTVKALADAMIEDGVLTLPEKKVVDGKSIDPTDEQLLMVMNKALGDAKLYLRLTEKLKNVTVPDDLQTMLERIQIREVPEPKEVWETNRRVLELVYGPVSPLWSKKKQTPAIFSDDLLKAAFDRVAVMSAEDPSLFVRHPAFSALLTLAKYPDQAVPYIVAGLLNDKELFALKGAVLAALAHPSEETIEPLLLLLMRPSIEQTPDKVYANDEVRWLARKALLDLARSVSDFEGRLIGTTKQKLPGRDMYAGDSVMGFSMQEFIALVAEAGLKDPHAIAEHRNWVSKGQLHPIAPFDANDELAVAARERDAQVAAQVEVWRSAAPKLSDVFLRQAGIGQTPINTPYLNWVITTAGPAGDYFGFGPEDFNNDLPVKGLYEILYSDGLLGTGPQIDMYTEQVRAINDALEDRAFYTHLLEHHAEVVPTPALKQAIGDLERTRTPDRKTIVRVNRWVLEEVHPHATPKRAGALDPALAAALLGQARAFQSERSLSVAIFGPDPRVVTAALISLQQIEVRKRELAMDGFDRVFSNELVNRLLLVVEGKAPQLASPYQPLPAQVSTVPAGWTPEQKRLALDLLQYLGRGDAAKSALRSAARGGNLRNMELFIWVIKNIGPDDTAADIVTDLMPGTAGPGAGPAVRSALEGWIDRSKDPDTRAQELIENLEDRPEKRLRSFGEELKRAWSDRRWSGQAQGSPAVPVVPGPPPPQPVDPVVPASMSPAPVSSSVSLPAKPVEQKPVVLDARTRAQAIRDLKSGKIKLVTTCADCGPGTATAAAGDQGAALRPARSVPPSAPGTTMVPGPGQGPAPDPTRTPNFIFLNQSREGLEAFSRAANKHPRIPIRIVIDPEKNPFAGSGVDFSANVTVVPASKADGPASETLAGFRPVASVLNEDSWALILEGLSDIPTDPLVSPETAAGTLPVPSVGSTGVSTPTPATPNTPNDPLSLLGLEDPDEHFPLSLTREGWHWVINITTGIMVLGVLVVGFVYRRFQIMNARIHTIERKDRGPSDSADPGTQTDSPDGSRLAAAGHPDSPAIRSSSRTAVLLVLLFTLAMVVTPTVEADWPWRPSTPVAAREIPEQLGPGPVKVDPDSVWPLIEKNLKVNLANLEVWKQEIEAGRLRPGFEIQIDGGWEGNKPQVGATVSRTSPSGTVNLSAVYGSGGLSLAADFMGALLRKLFGADREARLLQEELVLGLHHELQNQILDQRLLASEKMIQLDLLRAKIDFIKNHKRSLDALYRLPSLADTASGSAAASKERRLGRQKIRREIAKADAEVTDLEAEAARSQAGLLEILSGSPLDQAKSVEVTLDGGRSFTDLAAILRRGDEAFEEAAGANPRILAAESRHRSAQRALALARKTKRATLNVGAFWETGPRAGRMRGSLTDMASNRFQGPDVPMNERGSAVTIKVPFGAPLTADLASAENEVKQAENAVQRERAAFTAAYRASYESAYLLMLRREELRKALDLALRSNGADTGTTVNNTAGLSLEERMERLAEIRELMSDLAKNASEIARALVELQNLGATSYPWEIRARESAKPESSKGTKAKAKKTSAADTSAYGRLLDQLGVKDGSSGPFPPYVPLPATAARQQRVHILDTALLNAPEIVRLARSMPGAYWVLLADTNDPKGARLASDLKDFPSFKGLVTSGPDPYGEAAALVRALPANAVCIAAGMDGRVRGLPEDRVALRLEAGLGFWMSDLHGPSERLRALMLVFGSEPPAELSPGSYDLKIYLSRAFTLWQSALVTRYASLTSA